MSSVDHTLREVHRDFPDACAATELWTPLVPKMTCDDKDWHVLAVAVGANATHVLTINTRDFPVHSRPAGVIVQTPDRFLRDRLAETPDLVVDAIAALSQRLKNPTQTTTEIAKLLAKGQFIPNFGADLLDALGGRPGA